MGKVESDFQSNLITDLKTIFPGCIVLKNDSSYAPGIPDLSIFWKGKWAMLECKKSKSEQFRPGQEQYLRRTNEMSFGRVIYPENKQEVLDALQRSFGLTGTARVSRSK